MEGQPKVSDEKVKEAISTKLASALPSIAEVDAIRKRGSEKHVGEAIRSAAKSGSNEVDVKADRLHFNVRARLKQEGYTVENVGDYWVKIKW